MSYLQKKRKSTIESMIERNKIIIGKRRRLSPEAKIIEKDFEDKSNLDSCENKDL